MVTPIKEHPPSKNGTRVEEAERITAQEFLEIAPEDQKAELIDGVVIRPMPPLTIHGKLQVFLLTLLRMYSEEHDLGEIFGSRTPAILNGSYIL